MSGQARPIPHGLIAFVDANVLPMDREEILESYTVIVRDGAIAEKGPADRIQVPDEALKINASGAYLMPGLADMHTHLIEFDSDPRHLILYLVHGVTSVRSLNSPSSTFIWRDKVKSNEWLGPSIYLSGPAIVGVPPDSNLLVLVLKVLLFVVLVLISGLMFGITWSGMRLLFGTGGSEFFMANFLLPWSILSLLTAVILVWRRILAITRFAEFVIPKAAVVETPSQARAEVKRQSKAGVDFIKLYDYLNRETFFAALTCAKENGKYTAGHIPDDPDVIGVKEALAGGLDEIVHMDEISHEFWPDYNPKRRKKLNWKFDLSPINEISDCVVEHSAAVTATLITNEIVLLGLQDLEVLLGRKEYRLMRPKTVDNWRATGRFIKWADQEDYRRNEWRPFLMRLTKALQERGAMLLVGTDVSVEGIVPGAALHDELELLVEAGLTPFEALCCGTRNAGIVAKRMGVDSDWGTIKIGNRADLILLAKNPLENIGNTRSQMGLMLRGRWFPQTELDQMVADFVITYDQ